MKNDADIKLTVDGRVRYTVPQRISTHEDVTVYFRVADVYRDARIIVKSGDKVLINKKKQKLAPGEMETLTLTREMLLEVCDGVITFSIESEERQAYL